MDLKLKRAIKVCLFHDNTPSFYLSILPIYHKFQIPYIDILDRDKEIGIVRLRKDGDGQHEEKEVEKVGSGYLVDCIAGGFSMNPFIARAELFNELGKADERKIKGVAEISLREKYKYKTAKLNNAARGVCIHIGRGRRILGEET